MKPKLGVNIDTQGRYVARTKLDEFTHIVAKLPAVDYPLMLEVEHLSMQLARMAVANVCDTHLVPLERLAAQHKYDLGDPDLKSTNFLVVPWYDRKDQADGLQQRDSPGDARLGQLANPKLRNDPR